MEKRFTICIALVVMALVGYASATTLHGTHVPNIGQPVIPATVKPYATNTFTFSTVSGAGTAIDLGMPVCSHNITYYISGSWLTTPISPGNLIPIEGSNDNTNFVTLTNYWITSAGSATGQQLTNQCYRYVRAGWTSATNAFAWTTPATGRVNVLITSGGN